MPSGVRPWTRNRSGTGAKNWKVFLDTVLDALLDAIVRGEYKVTVVTLGKLARRRILLQVSAGEVRDELAMSASPELLPGR